MSTALSSSTGRSLKLRMRPDLETREMHYAGQRYIVVKDPLSLRYFHLREEEFFLLEQLDGHTSVDEIQRRFERRFAPRRITPPQLHSFLGTLHGSALAVAQAQGQAEELKHRGATNRRREMLSAVGNLLALRFRGIDPDSLLDWFYPLVRPLLSRAFVIASFLLIFAALALAAVKFDSLQARLPEFQSFFSAGNLFWLAVALAFSKVLHELGHAFVCKHFGGRCHELGVMLLVFTPCLYCNVSDAWMFPSRWRRIAVSAAGIWVDLMLAALCTFLWWFSEPGMFNALCLNLMFVCSVSTLLFNGNPLLRFDAYYILSDLWEVPNLQQQSSTLLRHTLARWLLDLELENSRMLPDRGRRMLIVYALASLVYRVVIVVGIVWFCHQVLKPYRLEVLAQLLAVVVAASMLFPACKNLWKFLQTPGRSREVNWYRVALAGLVSLAMIAGVCMIPLPYRVSAAVVLEAQQAHRIYVPVRGHVTQAVGAGEDVKAGQTLAKLQNLEVLRKVTQLEGEVAQQRLHVKHLVARQVRDPDAASQLPTAREALADLEDRLKQKREDVERLTLRAPRDGVVLPPPSLEPDAAPGALPRWSGTPLDRRNLGGHLETGELFCLVGDPQRLEAVLVVDQSDIEFIELQQRVRLALDQLPGDILQGTITEVSKLDLKITPRQLAAEGQLASQTDERGVARPTATSYQVKVALDEHQKTLVMRGSGQAKIHAQPLTLGQRLWRYLSNTFRLES